MSHSLTIHDGALFVADSHYPNHGDELKTLLEKIESDQIVTTQLFLMGDIFDLLFGYNDYILEFSSQTIELINRLSSKIEVVYLEGNHDFCLQEIFPKAKLYKREEQPLFAKMGKKSVALAHGDRYGVTLCYKIYAKLLRSKLTLTLLKPFEKIIIDTQMRKLKAKKICKKIKDFETIINRITSKYPKEIDFIVEGHFHQATVVDRYISLPSLVCQKEYCVAKNGKFVFVAL